MSTDALALPKPTVTPAAEAAWEIQQTSQCAPSGIEIVQIPIPASIESLTPLQIAIIMQSQPQWGSYDIPYLFYVQLRCKQLNLDPMSGDLYAIDGRLSTSDDAKIKSGRNSGKIEWTRISEPTTGTHPISGTKDIYCDATIKHKDEAEPQTYRAWFSEWNNAKNANWAKRPVESLQRKALARLSHRMFPMTDEDDFQPVATGGLWSASQSEMNQELRAAVMDMTPKAAAEAPKALNE